jgi:FkbM family methyltransferase
MDESQALESQFAKSYFSWEGEDIIALKIMNDFLGIRKGSYLDIGAYHPYQYSNTYKFYCEGWRGLNIDATPGFRDLFQKHRPDDINIETAVSDVEGTCRYHFFDNPTLNGILDDSTIQSHIARGVNYKGSMSMPTKILDNILETHWNHPEMDLLSIDIETSDLGVIKTLNLERWKPKMIIAEILGYTSINDILGSETVRYLAENNYVFFSRLHFSSIFVHSDYLDQERRRAKDWRIDNT